MEWSRTSLAVVTYVDFDLGARAAGVVGAAGLVGSEDPHAADATGLLVPLVERHVVEVLHHELRLAQLDTAEACGQVMRLAGVGGVGQRQRRRHYHQQQQQRARVRRRTSHVSD